MGAPFATEYAQSGADREVMALAYAQQAFGRPYILPPETPADRVAALRKGFIDTLHDKQLLAEARTALLEINPLSGAEVEALVGKLYATPAPLVELVRDALASRRRDRFPCWKQLPHPQAPLPPRNPAGRTRPLDRPSPGVILPFWSMK